jgi:tRNA A-37 threonylcarbamoyl transferase component Bud32
MALRITGLGEEIAAVTGLPWHLPLEEWPEDPVLAEKRGISRHVVRLVRASNDPNAEVYAVKETVSEFANREYKILRELTHVNAPCVEQVAVVEGRTDIHGEELPCAIVTRFLPYSLPYRVLLSTAVTAHEVTTMASALALLLVRLHLLGFWWGDCSLSNTLFRRDAEGFAAYLVDAETGEFQKTLSDGQREHDLDIVHFNVAAELEDLSLSGVLYPGMDPVRASDAVIRRYRRIWSALKDRQLLDPKDRHAVEGAMRSLHDLGFAVEEVAVTIDGDTKMISFQPKLVAAGYHSQRLRELMGLETEELQAKRVLASFDRYRSRESNTTLSAQEMAKKWLQEVFEPILDRVPRELQGRVERAQIFHEILENRWFLGEKSGYDVGLDAATDNYCTEVLPLRRDSGVDLVVE